MGLLGTRAVRALGRAVQGCRPRVMGSGRGGSLCEVLEARQLLSTSPVLQLFDAKPAVFVENLGQWSDASVYYAYNSPQASIAFGDEGLRLRLSAGGDGAEGQSTSLAMQFVGAHRVVPQGEQKAGGVYNYFLGEPANWRSHVSGYQTISYDNLYDGVSLKTFGQKGSLKYEFHVAAGADYQQVQIRYSGSEGLSIGADGSLHVQTPLGELVDEAPVIYQEIAGQRVAVAGRFVLLDESTYGFEVTGQWDGRYELVLDPDLVWSSYLGGSSNDDGNSIAIGSSGNVWVTGVSSSSGWVGNGFDASFNGTSDAFVAKINADGTLAWSSYLGGSGDDSGVGIALDGSGRAWITGETSSSGWASGGFDTSYNGGDYDAFVAQMNADGTLAWSCYLGGSSYDHGNDIAVDGDGNAWVTGTTASSDWASGGFDTSYNSGSSDAFVAKMNANGTLAWSSHLGGNNYDQGGGIAIDGEGNAWVTGATGLSNWASGGFNTDYNGGSYDAFVAKINVDGTLAWSSYLGGTTYSDFGRDVAVDRNGNAWVTGDTGAAGWVSGGFDTRYGGGTCDGFVARINADGTLAWSSYLGGTGPDTTSGIVVDGNGDAWVTGATGSGSWVRGGFDMSLNGNSDALVAKINADGTLAWSSYLGSDGDDYTGGIAIDGSGNVWVTGFTSSAAWAAGGFDTSLGGSGDAFVARIDPLITADTQAPISGPDMWAEVPHTTGTNSIKMVAATASDPSGVQYQFKCLTEGGHSSGWQDSTTYEDTGLAPGMAYMYEVQTRDKSGNLNAGRWSTAQSATTWLRLAPTDVVVTPRRVAEHRAIGATVGTLVTTDPNVGLAVTYRLVASLAYPDNALFTISDDHLTTAAEFNYEAKASYAIRVRVTNEAGLKFTKTLTIGVRNVNEVPTGVGISNRRIAENLAAGALVGTLGTTDPDAASTFSYALVDGEGGEDNAAFRVTATGRIRTNQAFDFEAKSSYSIRVRSTDQGGLFCEVPLTIRVRDVNEMPMDVVLSNSSVLQHQPAGTLVGRFSGTDPDALNLLSYSLVDGTGSRDNALFSVLGARLKTAAVFDYQTKSLYRVRVRVTDQSGLWFEKPMVISVVP